MEVLKVSNLVKRTILKIMYYELLPYETVSNLVKRTILKIGIGKTYGFKKVSNLVKRTILKIITLLFFLIQLSVT